MLGKKIAAMYVAFTTLLLFFSASAHAALPAAVTDIFTDLTADFVDLRDTYGFPLMGLILTAILLFKLIKRVANKAT